LNNTGSKSVVPRLSFVARRINLRSCHAHFSIALAETIIGQASVIDGDTLEIHGQRIQLSGIDAPKAAPKTNFAGCANYVPSPAMKQKTSAPYTCAGPGAQRWLRPSGLSQLCSTFSGGTRSH
jgi:endonuclease YncB( thermonuclease family)